MYCTCTLYMTTCRSVLFYTGTGESHNDTDRLRT